MVYTIIYSLDFLRTIINELTQHTSHTEATISY